MADTDKLYQNLQIELSKATRETVYLDIVFKELTPQYTTQDLHDININGIISSFNTSFDQNNSNCVHNIAIAAKQLNNIFIDPGQEISFNDLVIY